jgi:hypothetical protein
LKVDYSQNVKLLINDCVVETPVNKYPSFKDEIIFSTVVKDEDDFILTWVDYHLKLGVSRFIIYDNSANSTLADVLSDYIKQNIVFLIRWSYDYAKHESGISGQTTQQNHSIHTFRNAKYIGLFDVDEYVNIHITSNLHDFFQELIEKENIDVNKISSFVFLNKFFYNPNNLPTNDGQFLKIFNCDYITSCGHEKTFVIPKNTICYSVHAVLIGKPAYTLHEKYGQFNHYYFLNKSARGREVTHLTDNSILRNLATKD